MIHSPTDVQKEVREIVGLLMQRPITEAIAMRVEQIEGFEHLEVESGEWVGLEDDEYRGGEEHGRIEFRLLLRLGSFIEQHRLGMLYPGDTNFVLEGEASSIQTKRRPDIAFVAADRLKKTRGYIYGAPDLAIEIISPSERPHDIRGKLSEYLSFGVRQVWQVYPESREIIVHLPDDTSRTYRAGDTLTGSDVLPRFEMVVGEVFE
ncbi:MAG: Uma2 family endonuclease [Anaerolineae bacterium]|nr:Uma2 family endonuclease [Anaerolineae bacterium]